MSAGHGLRLGIIQLHLIATAIAVLLADLLLYGARPGLSLVLAFAVLAALSLIAGEGPTLTPQEAPRSYVGLFFAGVYGGFIQAGVGFLLLGVLVGTLRHNLITGNALKLVVTLAFGAVSLGIFVWADLVSWLPAVVLAAASIVGARLGVRLMLRVPIAGLRWFVFACVVATCTAAWLR